MDFETYSEAGFVWTGPSAKYPLGRWVAPEGAKDPGIKAVGAPAYSEHPTTEVLTLSYDLVDGRGIRRWRPGLPLPSDLFIHVMAGRPIEAHNALFERLIVENVCAPKYGWPVFPATSWRCSKARAQVAQYPGGLGDLTAVLGTSAKDKEGDRLIKKFCVPQQPIPGLVDKKTGRVKREDVPARRIRPEDDPEDFENLCLYCDRDVAAEMAAMEVVPELTPEELLAWQQTFEQNARGFALDTSGLRTCQRMLDIVLERYGAESEALTGYKSTQLQKLRDWLKAFGIETKSLDADHVEELLADPTVTGAPRRMLELRALTGSASVKKIRSMALRASKDGRLRDLVVHHGTRPGRPTGEGPQPLNLPKAGPKLAWCGAEHDDAPAGCGRPYAPQPNCPWCGSVRPAKSRKAWHSEMVDHVLEVMDLGSLEFVERFFGDAMLSIQGCIRGQFVADDESDLVSTDYSSLQAVVLACLSGEQWRIDAFREGKPMYLLGASKITGTPVEEYLAYAKEHGDHHPDRQKIGKVSELACGFGGWINSYRAFGSEDTDENIKKQIVGWRNASPAVVEMWGGQWRGSPWRREFQEYFGLEGHFIQAVLNPKTWFEWRNIGFYFDPDRDRLQIWLPQCDGFRRTLTYHQPRLTPSDRNPDEYSITYMTWNTNANYGRRGWIPMNTYGGRLCENVVMGVEVNIQRYGAKLMAEAGYPLVLSVYDENISEIPKGKPLTLGLPPVPGLDPYVQEIEHLLAIMPPEMDWWPIKAADGWRGRRYRKG